MQRARALAVRTVAYPKVGIGLGAGLVVLTVAMSAACQTAAPAADPFILRWTAPAECPSRDQVVSDIHELAVNRHHVRLRRPIDVNAVVERCGANCWRLTLAVGQAQRRLEAGTCVQAARAAALFVMLLMDPAHGHGSGALAGNPATADEEATSRGRETASLPEPSAPPVSSPLFAPAPDPSARAPIDRAASSQGEDAKRPRELSWLAAAALLVDVGTLPRPEPLGALEVGVRYKQAAIMIQGAAGPAEDTAGTHQAGLRLRPISVSLQPCYTPFGPPRLRFGACARAEVGWIHADSVDASNARTTDSPFVSVGGELVAWWFLGGPLEARLGAGAMVPVLRPNLEFDGYADQAPYLTRAASVYEPGVAGYGDIAAIVRF